MDKGENAKFTFEKRNIDSIHFDQLVDSYVYEEEDVVAEYNPYKIQKTQKYNPIHSLFFNISLDESQTISWNQPKEIQGLNKVIDQKNSYHKTPTFMKFSPLLDPIRYMIGKYKEDTNIVLTSIGREPSTETKTKEKIDNIHNASFVDAFFCYLSSQILNNHEFVNGIDFYGSYLGMQEKFKTNITDDVEYLYGSSFFKEKLNTLFSVSEHNDLFLGGGSRKNKRKIEIQMETTEDSSILDIEYLDLTLETLSSHSSTPEFNRTTTPPFGGSIVLQIHDTVESSSPFIESLETVYQNETICSRSTDESTDSSNNSKTNYSTDSGSDSGSESSSGSVSGSDSEFDSCSESSDESEDEKQIYAYIHDFPVQVICMEKCDGTIDELFSKGDLDEKEGASALFQVIMTLIVYQKAFHFTHNDLHTNNIMYKNTKIEYLYYIFNGKKYKVPTYGKIFKIIDFGRGIYTFQGKLLCSDSFAVGGDASTQYNFEPFLNKEKPTLSPNYSFDLCRLGCSIYDFIIDEEEYSEMDDFQKTIHRWCQDDSDKNILYKKDGSERYPNFKLYKMIARTVHNHTPEEQLKFSFFNQFETDKINKKDNIMDIDAIPCYVSQ